MSQLRYRVTVLNILVTGIVLAFFCSAPVFGFPATWDESVNIAQTIIPVFLGNIGFAAAYAADNTTSLVRSPPSERLKLITLLTYGSIGLFCIITMLASAVFWESNRRGVITTGSGMSLQALQMAIASSLSINTLTSNHLMARLFPQSKQ